MRRRWIPLAIGLLAAAVACGDDDGGAPATTTLETVPVTTFVWETAVERDGDGYVLRVEGVVGEAHALYTMQVEPLLPEGGGPDADVLAGLAGVAVNGYDDADGIETSSGPVDPEGETEVRVLGEERWYQNPWLLGEAAHAMGEASWVRVPSDEPVIADIVTAVLNERYDDSLRRLLAAVTAGEELVAPSPDEESSELDEILTPWVGLAGPAYPFGAEAVVSGDADRGEASWQHELDPARDGASGEMRGHVEWGATELARPPAPGPSIDVADLTAQFAG